MRRRPLVEHLFCSSPCVPFLDLATTLLVLQKGIWLLTALNRWWYPRSALLLLLSRSRPAVVLPSLASGICYSGFRLCHLGTCSLSDSAAHDEKRLDALDAHDAAMPYTYTLEASTQRLGHPSNDPIQHPPRPK